MKTLFLSLACAAGLGVSAQAQVFQPSTARDVLIGGIAGAIIGDNNHHHAAEGAAIGAVAGYVFNQLTQPGACLPAARTVVVQAPPVCRPVERVVVQRPICVSERRVVVVERPVCQPPPRVVYVTPRVPVYHRADGYVAYKESPAYRQW